MKNLEWGHLGSLKNLKRTNRCGVYLYILDKRPRRIVYVGTTHSRKKRPESYGTNLEKGTYTIWRPERDEDVYALMCHGPACYAVYQQLYKQDRMWLPDKEDKNDEQRRFLSKYDGRRFNDEWRNFVTTEYLASLDVYLCELADRGKAQLLETQLQQALGNEFRLGYYCGRPQNWLGHQAKASDPQRTTMRFRFKTLPNIGFDTLKVLTNLNDLLNP